MYSGPSSSSSVRSMVTFPGSFLRLLGAPPPLLSSLAPSRLIILAESRGADSCLIVPTCRGVVFPPPSLFSRLIVPAGSDARFSLTTPPWGLAEFLPPLEHVSCLCFTFLLRVHEQFALIGAGSEHNLRHWDFQDCQCAICQVLLMLARDLRLQLLVDFQALEMATAEW